LFPPDAETRAVPRRTLVAGVLGGIASGKSLAARELAGPEGRVIDADRLAHEVLASPEVSQAVARHFGPGFLDAEGRPDRARLAAEVFSHPERRRLLEGWIHPRVRATIRNRLASARASGVPLVVLDVPLLLERGAEAGLAKLCDVLVFVDAPLEARDARARAARGWAPGEVARREASQAPLADKRAASHHVLDNRGTSLDLERRARALRALLLRRQ
jgi:dephospho-CoA kinase